MKLKNYLFAFMAMLAMVSGIQQPLVAAKKHSESSSTSRKDDKCCKKSKKLLQQINQTTMQDLVVDQTTLNIANQINQTTRTDLAVDQETLDIVTHLQDCSCTCTVIMPQDFADEDGNLSQTYVITEPGNYCLGANVVFSPSNVFVPAIRILASDVHLNLRGFTLSQSADNRIPFGYGVILGQGYFYNDPNAVLISNVTVENGTVSQFTGCGILAYNASFDNPNFEVIPFTNLHFSGLNILDCGIEGFPVDGTQGLQLGSNAPFIAQTVDSPVAFSDVLIENCNVNRCTGGFRGAKGITVYNFDNLVVHNCQANDVVTRNAFGSGNTTAGYYFVGRNLQMTNCQGNGTTDLDPRNFNAQVGGIFVQLSLNVYMKDCQFNDAYGESNSIVNSNLSLNNNFVAENCQFNNARGGEFAQIVAGVHCSSSLTSFVQGNGIKWINCQFNGASVSPINPINLFVTGFLSTCMRGMTFEDCQACNHQGADATWITSGFYNVAFDSDSPGARFSDSDNITYQNCIASDIEGANNTYGFFVGGGNLNLFGTQLVHNNMVLKNCIAERIHSTSDTAQIAGIAESLSDPADFFNDFGGTYPLQIDLFISDCRVSDVRSIAETPSPLSAGILVQSVIHPVIQNNSISDCDRGILLTGIDEIVPNCFQLAATPDDAVATPPVFINLVGVTTSLTPPPSYSPAPAGTFRLHIDNQSLPPHLQNNNLNLYYFSGAGASNPFPSPFSSPGGSVNNLGPADGVAFLGVQDSGFDDYGPFWTFDLDFLVNFFDGEQNVEAAFGFIYIDATTYFKESRDLLISVPIADILRANNGGDVFHGYLFSGPQTFKNLAQGNQVDVSPIQVDSIRDFICPSENLTSLGWQASDPILYNNNGNGNIPELETATTYYAIVYNPGFSRNGLIQNNKIDNCSISCYQDDAPTTLSGWVDNTAFNCGIVPSQFTNYDINFAGVRPVDAGTLVSYPVGGNKYFNLSLVP